MYVHINKYTGRKTTSKLKIVCLYVDVGLCESVHLRIRVRVRIHLVMRTSTRKCVHNRKMLV